MYTLACLCTVCATVFFFRIVQLFENIVDVLIQQENFTNITVIADDVVLVGERVRGHTRLRYLD